MLLKFTHKEISVIEMKHTSAEPPKKKLKQARLPFQLISSDVKNAEVATPEQRKRKASETNNYAEVCEITDVKENKITSVEKKPKLVNHESSQVIGDVKTSGKSNSKTSHRGNNCTTNNEKEESVILDYIDLSSPCKKDNKSGDDKSEAVKHKEVSIIDIECENELSKESKQQVKTKEETNTNFLEEINNKNNNLGNEANKQTTTELEKQVEKDKISDFIPSENNKVNIENSKENVVEKSNSASPCEEKDSENENKCKQAKSKHLPSPKQVSIKNLVTKTNTNKDCEKESDIEKSREIINKKSATCTSDQSSTKNSSSGIQSSPATSNSPCDKDESLVETFLSPTTSDVSTSSSCKTPATSKTPNSAKKNLNSSLTPGRMTPKQLNKLKEKEEKRKEKERLKQEKEKKRAEEREEKLKLKKEKEDEKNKLKLEKEEEKRKEREEKERKKQLELEQKNEEKRLKEEEKRLKEEEKRAKEEEKKKKEEEEKKKKEEKKLKEEQKEAEKRKSAQAFASFFVKSETKSIPAVEDKENTPVDLNFQPFEVKIDMRLAPSQRVQLSEQRKQVLDKVIHNDSSAEQRLYLDELRSPSYSKGISSRTWPPPDETDDEVIFIESEKPNEETTIDEDICQDEKKPEKKHQRAKLLQFHENRRPPYWGTWRKNSKLIRPRAPLNQDKVMFEYDIDSDDEWEEPEDGESLRGSEDEESQDEQYEEDNEMFVPHGYLSDEEGQDEFDDKSPEAMKAKLKFLQVEFETERNEKQEKLKPRLIGCVWLCNSVSNPAAVGVQIADLFLSRRAVWEGNLPVVVAPLSSTPTTPTEVGGEAETVQERGAKRKIVHESMIPHIIKKVHGSRRKLSKIIMELLEEQSEVEIRPSKRCLADKIRELAVWKRSSDTGPHCWCVKEEVLKAHGLENLRIETVTPVCASPSVPSLPASNITKFTKVLTSDERLKLLRDSPPANALSKEAAKSLQTSKQVMPSSKTPSIKLTTPAKSGSTEKKRVPLLESVGLGQPLPKQSPASIMKFVVKTPNNTSPNEQKPPRIAEKVRKRITPITLTDVASKPPPTYVVKKSGLS